MHFDYSKTNTTMTVREATYDLLRQLGLTTVFGNPGSTEQAFLTKFPPDFTYVLGLQEASVLAMADGFAQATGKPALVNIHTGAGTANAMGSLITAYLNKTPLIVTAGQQTREMLLLEPWLTNVEAPLLPQPWVKWSYEPMRAEDVPGAFMRAYATALQPPAGPVYLTLPLDDWTKDVSQPAVVRTVSARVAPDPVRLAEFARRLAQCKSPVLVLGAAIDKAGGWDDAIRLAEKVGAPVWAPPASERVSFPEDHPLYQGILPFAIGLLSEKLNGHDLVLVIGAPVFRYYPYVPGDYLPTGTELLHVTDDPAEAARAPVGDSLLGDAVLTLQALTDQLPDSNRPLPRSRTERPSLPDKPSDQLTAADVYWVMNDVRPDNAVLVEESPSNLADFHRWLPITQPQSFFTFASGGLGWALPAAVGIALGERATGRNRPVLVAIGDGSFQYSLQALWTAVQHALPVVYVVLNNSEYAILKAFAYQEDTPDVPGLDLPGINIVALANGYGCNAERVMDKAGLSEALRRALSKKGPTVIEVPINPTIPALL